MNSEKRDVHALNSVIETTIDSMLGYVEAANKSRRSEFRILFDEHAVERQRMVTRLQEQVRQLDGVPVDEGTFTASMHRFFVDLKAALTKGDRAVINEVERGEGHIKAKYQECLEENHLSAPTRQLLQECYQMILAAHDQMSSIKHAI